MSSRSVSVSSWIKPGHDRFRAKPAGSDQWVYGQYLCALGQTKSAPIHWIIPTDELGFGEPATAWIPIRPETLGRRSYYQDCNETDIYEGDVIEVATHSGKPAVYGHCEFGLVTIRGNMLLGLVHEMCGFYIFLPSKAHSHFRFPVRKMATFDDALLRYRVIGNLVDSPELMEKFPPYTQQDRLRR